MEVQFNDALESYEIQITDPTALTTEPLNFDDCNNCYIYMECKELSCKVKNMHSLNGNSLAMYGATPFLAG